MTAKTVLIRNLAKLISFLSSPLGQDWDRGDYHLTGGGHESFDLVNYTLHV